MNATPATEAFFRDALAGAQARGRLQIVALDLDGTPIAMLVNFITAPGAYSYKTAFDEAYARFSPGMLLQLENLALLERGDVHWADSCAVEGHPMIERLWRDGRRMVSCNIAIGGPLRRAASMAEMTNWWRTFWSAAMTSTVCVPICAACKAAWMSATVVALIACWFRLKRPSAWMVKVSVSGAVFCFSVLAVGSVIWIWVSWLKL